MIRRPTRSTRNDTLLPDTTHIRALIAFDEQLDAKDAPPTKLLSDRQCDALRLGHRRRRHRLRLPRLLIVAPLLAMADRLTEARRSEEHTSELQSLMRISYAVFFLIINTLHFMFIIIIHIFFF